MKRNIPLLMILLIFLKEDKDKYIENDIFQFIISATSDYPDQGRH